MSLSVRSWESKPALENNYQNSSDHYKWSSGQGRPQLGGEKPSLVAFLSRDSSSVEACLHYPCHSSFMTEFRVQTTTR